jgi:hypothetical protein
LCARRVMPGVGCPHFVGETKAKMIVEGHDYDFPVIGYERKTVTSSQVARAKNVYGTAFSIGDNYFLTAGHSIDGAASENDVLAVGFIDGERYIAAEALDYEVIPELDIGIIKTIANVSRAKAFP